MKILIVNSTDLKGGAGKAGYRLHRSLLNTGIDSQLLVQYKMGSDSTVIELNNRFSNLIFKARSILDSLPLKNYSNKNQAYFSSSWLPFSGVVQKINQSDADLVHFHWLASGLIRVEELKKIKKPIVITLHDMWAFTGGCYYDQHCGKYVKECGRCPVLGSDKDKDLSRRVFHRKKRAYEGLDITVVGLSRWLADSARESALLGEKRIINLPNPIDTDLFKPMDKMVAKKILGLSTGKKHIIFGAVNAAQNPRKGFRELSASLDKLDIQNVELGIFGSDQSSANSEFQFPVRHLGRFHDEISLQVLYSAADVMVVPSRQENLSNMIMESLSCGTPVVAFDIGGNGDMIEHKKCGYLAAPFSSEDFSAGIEWVLAHPEQTGLPVNARSKVLQEFDSNVVAAKYISLYQDILNRKENV